MEVVPNETTGPLVTNARKLQNCKPKIHLNEAHFFMGANDDSQRDDLSKKTQLKLLQQIHRLT